MTALKVCLITILLTLIYLITSVLFSNLLFYNKANCSLIKIKNKITGSKLLGQRFNSNKYFHNRPSSNDYKNQISGNSNYPYYSKELIKNITENYNQFKTLNNNSNPDLNIITESASGLDPHITYEAAVSQLDRVSSTTGIQKDKIINILNEKAERRLFNLFGSKIVNVLELNIEIMKLLEPDKISS